MSICDNGFSEDHDRTQRRLFLTCQTDFTDSLNLKVLFCWSFFCFSIFHVSFCFI